MRRCRRSRTVHVSCDRDMVGEAVVWRITRNAYFREAGAALSGAPPVRLNCAAMGSMGERGNAPLWGGRFGSSPAEAFERLNASIPFDARLAPHDIRGSIAHAKMLGERGIVTKEESAELVRGLEVVLGEVEAGQFSWTLSDEDVHTAVERRLREQIGGGALKLHTGRRRHDQGGPAPAPSRPAGRGAPQPPPGRSRNDQVALDLHLFVREAAEGIRGGVLAAMRALVEVASANREVVVRGCTR